jgi:hypothetical protein
MLDEMTQAFGSVGGQMEDVFKLVFSMELLHERGIRDRTPDKFHAFGNVIAKAAAQIVQASHLVSRFEQMPANVRTNKARRAGDQNL